MIKCEYKDIFIYCNAVRFGTMRPRHPSCGNIATGPIDPGTVARGPLATVDSVW